MFKYTAVALIALGAAPAFAADFSAPIYDPQPMAYQASTTWTGFYVGAFGALAGGDVIWADPTATVDFEMTSRGGLFGIQAGADYQFDQVVVGAVIDVALTNTEGAIGSSGARFGSKLDYLGTLRARAGFTPTDEFLAYVHGGLAWGRTTPFSDPGGVVPFVSPDRAGFTVGAGAEYRLTENVSLMTEYAYTDLGTKNVIDASAGFAADETWRQHTVKAGVNFRF